ncbi:MAG: DsrE family protein [Syntrophaceae bacterium]|nr:DsrE family protein [Syntrophaceae bacterium]
MSDEKTEKMVIFVTHGGEDPERATLPFVVANAALAMEVGVTVILQGTAVTLAKKGCYEHVFAAGLDPLKKQVDNFFEFGGVMYVCIPCIEERKITPDMLVEKAKLVKAGTVVQACLEANAVLNY